MKPEGREPLEKKVLENRGPSHLQKEFKVYKRAKRTKTVVREWKFKLKISRVL